jgi:DNA-binding IclR family transcriptional regulator
VSAALRPDEPDAVNGTVPRAIVPAISRAAAVLDALAASPEPVSLAQLAASIRLPKSSLHNVCSTLVTTGLVDRGTDGRFQIGLRTVELARHRIAGMSLVNCFQETARAAGPTPHTLVLGVLRGADVMYVSIIVGEDPIAVRYEIGMRLPAAFTATGKAILATLPDDRVHQTIGAGASSDAVHAGPKPIAALLAELGEIRALGYSLDDEEVAHGMMCLGASITGAGGSEAVGAIAVSTLKARTEGRREALAIQVRDLADRISLQLGGRPLAGAR